VWKVIGGLPDQIIEPSPGNEILVTTPAPWRIFTSKRQVGRHREHQKYICKRLRRIDMPRSGRARKPRHAVYLKVTRRWRK